MNDELIKRPVRYNGNLDAVFESSWVEGREDSHEHPQLFDLWAWKERNRLTQAQTDDAGEYIATCINEYPDQAARISELEAEVERLKKFLKRVTSHPHWNEKFLPEIVAEFAERHKFLSPFEDLQEMYKSLEAVLTEACKKALTCASINSDVRSLIQAALKEETR